MRALFHQTLLRIFAAVFHQQQNSLPQTLQTLLLCAPLAIGFRDFRAEGDEPFAFTMHFR